MVEERAVVDGLNGELVRKMRREGETRKNRCVMDKRLRGTCHQSSHVQGHHRVSARNVETDVFARNVCLPAVLNLSLAHHHLPVSACISNPELGIVALARPLVL